MRKLKIEEVKYLAFQGGGGKGATYAGAIRPFEGPDLGVERMNEQGEVEKIPLLPLRPGSPLKGISGTSAGSITALFLACGMTVSEINEVVKGGAFEVLFEQPSPGIIRAVKYKNGKNLPGYMVPEVHWTSGTI